MPTKLSVVIAASIVAIGATAIWVTAAPKSGATLTVRVLRAKVMKKPKFIGASAATVSRGATLTFKEAKGQWYRVEGSAGGWIHKGHVLEGAVKLASTPGREGSSASQDEVDLAGRGFTPQVEDEYKKRNPKLDFSHISKIEGAAETDTEELALFAQEGGLR
jgi:hypothetical protein